MSTRTKNKESNVTNAELKDIHRIIKSGKTSSYRTKGNMTHVQDSTSFNALPIRKQEEVNAIVTNATKRNLQKDGIPLTTLHDLKKDASRKIEQSMLSIVQDNRGARYVRDNIFNSVTGVGTGEDPTTYASVSPNLWLSPYEASSLYSQKGLPELIINKKAKSIYLNGIKIKNKLLNGGQLDQISLNMVAKDMPKHISNAVRDALVYGGDLVFPVFKKDNPISMMLSFKQLVSTGILKKDSVDFIVSLDRWNVMHLPFTNPTQRDYMNPKKYYIPYLGSDVNGERCSRIVTGEQAGFIGQVATLGWGLSDFCGYMREIINYKAAVNTIPIMIQQMSILARTIPVDGILASEGANALDAIMESNTISMREMSMSNPVNLDMLGDLKVINRDFAEVPSLIRLLRQDAASAASLPEPMLWSSEKGNFSSGDDTQGNLAKQYESVKYIHSDVQNQFKNLAKILIIDALGSSDEVLRALPYTEIHFDVPMVANSTERAQIGKDLSNTLFQLVAAQMPLDVSALIMSNYGGDEMTLSSEILEGLKTQQAASDAQAKEKHQKEMELLDAQIEHTKKGSAEGSSSLPVPIKKESKQYTKLEQKSHEKTRLSAEKRKENITKNIV